jgi:uncharacterized protein (TIGR02145 family)
MKPSLSILVLLLGNWMSLGLLAQVCDPAVAPTGLTSTYTPGTGALLEWDAVPGSVGVQLRIDLPSGSAITRRLAGFERDQFAVPDALLTPGSYTWRVQAACSTTPPYDVTPISAISSFTVGGGVSCPSTVTDIDGNVYPTAEIGGQCWMAENLKVEHYGNGDSIPTGMSDSAWIATTSGAFVAYEGDPANVATYGLLYNWFTVIDSRGICPTGWHVPSESEQAVLISVLGGETVAGCKMKTTGTLSEGTGLWQSPNTAATNSSGFSGLPGGLRGFDGFFLALSGNGYWWTSSEHVSTLAWYWFLSYNYRGAYRSSTTKQFGLSVRCLKD